MSRKKENKPIKKLVFLSPSLSLLAHTHTILLYISEENASKVSRIQRQT